MTSVIHGTYIYLQTFDVLLDTADFDITNKYVKDTVNQTKT